MQTVEVTKGHTFNGNARKLNEICLPSTARPIPLRWIRLDPSANPWT